MDDAFAVVRHHFQDGAITVVKVVWTKERADEEVKRLDDARRDGTIRHFWHYTKVEPR
jgi:hypothetical protein